MNLHISTFFALITRHLWIVFSKRTIVYPTFHWAGILEYIICDEGWLCQIFGQEKTVTWQVIHANLLALAAMETKSQSSTKQKPGPITAIMRLRQKRYLSHTRFTKGTIAIQCAISQKLLSASCSYVRLLWYGVCSETFVYAFHGSWLALTLKVGPCPIF